MSDICARKHHGNPESELANRRIASSKSYLRELIYQAFLFRGRAGATCEQVSQVLGVRYTTCSARISELKADRWLVPTGERGKTTGGSSAAILRAQTKAERDGTVFPAQQLELIER